MRSVYLDYNATTPVDPLATRELLHYLEDQFGNPSNNHHYGKAARAAVELARSRVAGLLGCLPQEVIFTSGGTESNNHALIGFAFANRYRGNHIVSSQIEHPAVLEPLKWLERHGFEVTLLPDDAAGRVDPAEVRRAGTENVPFMAALGKASGPCASVSAGLPPPKRSTRQRRSLPSGYWNSVPTSDSPCRR